MGLPLVTAVSTLIVLNGAGNAVSQEHIPMMSMKECHAYARQVLGGDVVAKNDTFVRRSSITVDQAGGGSSFQGTLTREIVCAVTRS